MISIQASKTEIPKEIAAALVLIMRSIGKVTRESFNSMGKYKYASVDQFLAVTAPACSEAGILVKPVLVSAPERVTIDVHDRDTKQTRPRRMVRYRYKFRLIHESGVTWTDDDDTREVQLDDTGPQTLMAAESYCLKGYLRTLLQIPTGDADADAQEQHDAEIIKATVRAHKAKQETGAEQVLLDFGNGPEPLPAAEVKARVLKHLVEIGDKKDAADWWGGQKHGREQFHNQFPKLALDLKRQVEGFLSSAPTGTGQ